MTLAVVFCTSEVKHKRLALGPLSVCIFEGFSGLLFVSEVVSRQIVNWCEKEKGGRDRSDKWCLCVRELLLHCNGNINLRTS